MARVLVPGIQDRFEYANQIDLTQTDFWETLGKVALVATGMVKKPAQDRAGDWIVGLGYRLSESERQRNHIQLDTDGSTMSVERYPQDSDLIWTIRADSTSPADMSQKLIQRGITVQNDAPGVIYHLPSGKRIVEFWQGMGLQGAKQIYLGNVYSKFQKVAKQIETPLSELQAVSLAVFVSNIGVENFLGSDVLRALNAGNYQHVPQLMEAWSAQPIFPGGPVKRNAALFAQRRFEGSVFQTPSQVPVNIVSDSYTPGSATWLEFAQSLDAQRERFIQSLID